MAKIVKLAAVGDLAPLKSITHSNTDNTRQVWQQLRQADLSMANLEIALTYSEVRADKAITLKADPNLALTLAEAGFDVLSIANNHALDFGAKGLSDTIEALNQVELVSVGGGENIDAAMSPSIIEVNGLRIACFGMCSALPTGFGASKNRPGVAPVRARAQFYIDSVTLDEQPGISPWVETRLVMEDAAYACQRVREAKAIADLVVVNIHWGIPNGWCALFQGPLADYQQPLAHMLIDAGADLILGHHPHVVHGLEIYGSGLIAYSLGNFLFHSMAADHVTKLTTKYPPYNVDSLEEGEAREAVILEIDCTDQGWQKARLYPVGLNFKGEPEYLDGSVAEAVIKRIDKHSRLLGTELQILGDKACLQK